MLAKPPWLMATSKLTPHLQGSIEEGKSKKILAASSCYASNTVASQREAARMTQEEFKN